MTAVVAADVCRSCSQGCGRQRPAEVLPPVWLNDNSVTVVRHVAESPAGLQCLNTVLVFAVPAGLQTAEQS